MQEDEYIAVKLSPNPDTKYKIFDSKNTLVTGNVFDISYQRANGNLKRKSNPFVMIPNSKLL